MMEGWKGQEEKERVEGDGKEKEAGRGRTVRGWDHEMMRERGGVHSMVREDWRAEGLMETEVRAAR